MKRPIPVVFALAACVVALGAATVPQPRTVTGTVFWDINGDGSRDPGEPGIPGVVVSNGREVATTNRRGRYILPAYDDMVVAVTKPAGWTPPLTESNIPELFYIHRPDGSPLEIQDFGGLLPTGPLPGRVDFALLEQTDASGNEDEAAFKAVLIGDTEACSVEEIGQLRDAVLDELGDASAALTIALGNNVGGDLYSYADFLSAMKGLGTPFYAVPGDRDLNLDSPEDAYSFDTFTRELGPTHYSFDYGRVHFVVLDSIVYPSTLYSTAAEKRYHGEVDPEQLDWLANDLAHVPKDHLIVLSTHIPFASNTDRVAPWNQVANGEAVAALLEGRTVLALGGHTRTRQHLFPGGESPFRQINVGAACGPGEAKGYLILDFNENLYRDPAYPTDRTGGPVGGEETTSYSPGSGSQEAAVSPQAIPFPAGGVILWSGTLDSIPAGWKICDGTNGTPDLRDRFILGVDVGENPGATGGSHTFALSAAQLPAHAHSFTTNPGGNHGHTLTTSSAGSHTHSYSARTLTSGLQYGDGNGSPRFAGSPTIQTSSSGNHTHTATTVSTGLHQHSGNTNSTGGSGVIDNRPAYYKVAFIMGDSTNVPVGGILMWSGTVASIPAGWQLCDGTNGSPDLTNRFVLGVSAGENPGATGGSHSLTLTLSQLPSHSHGFDTSLDGTHSHPSFTTSAAGAHTHQLGTSAPRTGSSYGDQNGSPHFATSATVSTSSAGLHEHIGSDTSFAGNHTHSGTTDNAGGNAEINNRPSYHKLAFIMRKSGALPPGGIIMWSGALSSIPAGWQLANGTGGTPDMTDRFVHGAAVGENPGERGGFNTYKLTLGQMPTHSHTFTAPAAGEHRHGSPLRPQVTTRIRCPAFWFTGAPGVMATATPLTPRKGHSPSRLEAYTRTAAPCQRPVATRTMG